jgi:hypothetical protein
VDALKVQAKHFDEGKPPLDQLPFKALSQVAHVMAFGAKKYGRYNWRAGQAWTKYAASTLRHTFAWIYGEDTDPESGFSHLAHAVCNLIFLMEWQRTGVGEDDRYHPLVATPVAELCPTCEGLKTYNGKTCALCGGSGLRVPRK